MGRPYGRFHSHVLFDLENLTPRGRWGELVGQGQPLSRLPPMPFFPSPTMTNLTDIALVPVTPTIHSSDESTVLGDPFKFFLRRRLGLICLLEYSQALNRGQWLHLAYQHSDSKTGEFDAAKLAHIAIERHADTIIRLRSNRIGGDTITDFGGRDQDDMHIAAAWWNGARQIVMPNSDTIIDYFAGPDWVLLDRELDLKADASFTEDFTGGFHYRVHPATIRIDALYYHKKLNAIFPVDLKSCSETPWTRAQRCEIEFQRQLYLDVTERKLMTLKKNYCIPTDAHLGGMIHVIIQKPPLEFGQKDRRYHYESEGKRSKRTGTARLATDQSHWDVNVWDPGGDIGDVSYFSSPDEHAAVTLLHAQTGKAPDKVYAGEPDPTLFARRVLAWYKDQPLTDEETGQPCCPVNISTTPPLDKYSRAEYMVKLRLIAHYCTVAPDPVNFPKSPSGMGGYGRPLSRWAPFYVTPIEHWPEIIQRGHFIVDHRDPEVDNA